MHPISPEPDPARDAAAEQTRLPPDPESAKPHPGAVSTNVGFGALPTGHPAIPETLNFDGPNTNHPEGPPETQSAHADHPAPAAHAAPAGPATSLDRVPPTVHGSPESAVLPFSASTGVDQTLAAPAGSPHGTLVGPAGYEILAELGRGGMGVVYKARQVSLSRLVALKMILAGGHAGADELRRFQAEAEAVAQLQHPHIVQIYEIGACDGMPFFSLEYVEGGTLADRIAHTPQNPRQAAHLLRQLAEAVECAHRRGIVHRDLKPANVLLAGPADAALDQCTPKVTDFGLARRLEADVGHTREGAILGTPSYMAPEQARGRAHEAGPAADVYALGAILYDLLTGGPPFRGPTALDVLQQVVMADPLPPGQLQPGLPRDLGVICLKSLQKDPARRYASAGELADDLGRFLAGEPIRARATPAWERLAKWARRRPAVTALIVVIVAAVLTLAGGSLLYARTEQRLRHRAEKETLRAETALQGESRQRERAESNFRDARDAVRELTQLGHKRLAHEPYMELVRRDLLEKALAFHLHFLRANGDVSDLRWETARARMRAGEIQTELGRRGPAEQLYREALSGLAELRKEAPARAAYRQDEAAVWNNLGILLQVTHQPDRAATAFGRAGAILDGLVAEFPGKAEYRRDLAGTHNNRGTLRHARGQLDEALADYRRAQELFERLAADHPLSAVPRSGARVPTGGEEEPAGYQEELARTHMRLGALWTGRRPVDAERETRQALDLWKKLADRFAAVPRYRHERASALLLCGTLHHLARRLTDAERDYTEAETGLSRLTAEFASMPDYRQVLANVYRNKGQLLRETGHPRAAEKAWRAAATELTVLAALFPDDPSYRQQLGISYNEVGIALTMQRRPLPAVAAWRKALEVQEPLVRQRPADAACWQALIDTHTNRTAVLIGQSPSAESEAAARALVDAQRRRLRAFPKEPGYGADLARACQTLARLLSERKESDGAVASLAEAVQHARSAVAASRQPGAFDAILCSCSEALAELHLGRADHAGAAAVVVALDAQVACQRNVRGRLAPERAAELLARCMTEAGKDVRLSESRREQVAQEYGNRAMDLLRRAVDQGYRDHQALAGDAFKPLRSRADFPPLIRRVRGKGSIPPLPTSTSETLDAFQLRST